MNVMQLIKALQAVPDLSADVTVVSAGAGVPDALGTVDVSGANSTTFDPDAPDGVTPDPGTVALSA